MSRHACMSAQMSSPPAPALTAVLLLCPHCRPFPQRDGVPQGPEPRQGHCQGEADCGDRQGGLSIRFQMPPGGRPRARPGWARRWDDDS